MSFRIVKCECGQHYTIRPFTDDIQSKCPRCVDRDMLDEGHKDRLDGNFVTYNEFLGRDTEPAEATPDA